MLLRSLFLVCLFTFTSSAQQTDHWESIIQAGDVWRYKLGLQEPNAAWRQLDFNDIAWAQGRSSIGYGDDDDRTQIAPVVSLYLRKSFEIFETSSVTSLSFYMDYDDAFVAYLNDVEIARSEGLTGTPPRFHQTSSVDHEAQLYQGGRPEEFSVQKNLLRPGQNILAIQVHNVSPSSSDMTALPFLIVGLNTSEHFYRPTPEWFNEPLAFESSNLPIVVIDTGGRAVVNEPKRMARMGVIYNGPGKRNYMSDPFKEYEGWIGIELRGNKSLDFDKKPYTIETRLQDERNNNVELLGMPRENDWVLRAAYIDKTFLRDALAYYMSRSIGRWAPRTRHVELVFNGKYRGIYVLAESIKPDDDRLDITQMDSTDIAGEAVTGGYIWEVAQRGEGFGERRRFKYPKDDNIVQEQIDYIRNYDDALRDMMQTSYYDDPVRGYPAWIDVSAFIDKILVQEATGNSDAYGWSSYFYKDRGQNLSAGPVWDFDQALSNSTFNCGSCVEEWTIEKFNDAYPQFWKKLWYDEPFKEALANRWVQVRQGPLRTEPLFAFVDSLAAYLDEAQARNFQRWPILESRFGAPLPALPSEIPIKKKSIISRIISKHTWSGWMRSWPTLRV